MPASGAGYCGSEVGRLVYPREARVAYIPGGVYPPWYRVAYTRVSLLLSWVPGRLYTTVLSSFLGCLGGYIPEQQRE